VVCTFTRSVAFGVGAGARLERRDDQPRGGARRALLGGRLVQVRLRGLLLDRRRRARPGRLERRDLRPYVCTSTLYSFLSTPSLTPARTASSSVAFRLKAHQVLADHEPQGVERFLIVGLELGPGGGRRAATVISTRAAETGRNLRMGFLSSRGLA